MRTGIESFAYFDYDKIEQGLVLMKKHGYDCLDFQQLYDTDNCFYTESAIAVEKRLTDIRNAAARTGIEIYQAHGPWRWPPQDATEADRAERFEKMSRALYECAVLGCPYLVIHPIMPYGWEEDPEPERMWALNKDYYTRLAEEAGKAGTVLALENMPMPKISIASPEQIVRLVREIASPYLRVCLDTGHCTMFGSPADAVRLIGKDLLATLHVHDNDGRRDWHWMPYTGVIDWDAFCTALGEIGFEGPLNLEMCIKGTMPPDIKEYMQVGLWRIAKALADRTEAARQTK